MSRTFRYQEIAARIRSDIVDGPIEDGVLLPSESELSAAHGASRVTVRKALEQLRDEGLIHSRQGFGWTIGVTPLRQSLDDPATIERQLAAAGRHGERRVLSFQFIKPQVEVQSQLGVEVLEVVRLNLADGEPFAYVTVWCDQLLGSALSRRQVEESTFVELLEARLGHATQVISAVAASPAIAEVLGVEIGAPLLRIWRETFGKSGDPVLVSEHLYPASRTEFEVTLVAPASEPAGLRLVE